MGIHFLNGYPWVDPFLNGYRMEAYYSTDLPLQYKYVQGNNQSQIGIEKKSTNEKPKKTKPAVRVVGIAS